MCRLLIFDDVPPGYRRVVRKRVRRERLHRFATDRYLAARSAGAAKVWRSVMDACVVSEVHCEPDRRQVR